MARNNNNSRKKPIPSKGNRAKLKAKKKPVKKKAKNLLKRKLRDLSRRKFLKENQRNLLKRVRRKDNIIF